ncbi:expressed unknown protein [Seminavis robusta]|uniref:Uncharacterized protein n=1 Tax=Seminavis robusta TaxID=568900 RepID=A0A9N8DYV3_9STRA|nr:expressed unknown protein [Seminavis robusta]|eukprot:Sro485_g152410.1 n/a (386) ;mRNA; r:32381-33538
MTSRAANNDEYTEPLSSAALAAQLNLPASVADPALLTYRSVGIGCFGVLMRFGGMPLEKIALFMNSSQVSGKGQFGQAIQLTFKDGALAPYRVVGRASLVAWFFQYSVMGFAFQLVDQGLSKMMGVPATPYGSELMKPPGSSTGQEGDQASLDFRIKSAAKTLLAPILAASLESKVSNRAEVQRYFGKQQFATIESNLLAQRSYPLLSRMAGPAFFPSAMRNTIMCQTTFVLTPITYKLYFPQEHKTKSSLFWYGLSMNIFVGNVAAITQQALWGRSLDMLAEKGRIDYSAVIRQGLHKEGIAAFFTVPKWGSRVLMNAPAQGVLPWFYNDVLPLGERTVLAAVKTCVYEPFWNEVEHTTTARLPEAVKVETQGPPRFTANSPRS